MRKCIYAAKRVFWTILPGHEEFHYREHVYADRSDDDSQLLGAMNPFTLQKAQVSNEAWMVSLQGAVDASNVEAIESAVREVFEIGGRHVLIDLKQAEFVSSTGFSAFLKIADDVDEKGGRTIFLGTPPRIKEIFKLLGLYGTLSFAEHTQEALAYLAVFPNEPSGIPPSEKI